MELARKTPEELTELAQGIVTNRVYAAWDDESLEYSFGMFLMLVTGSAQEKGEDTSWLGDIGLVYQDIDKAGEKGVNGYPAFLSAQFLHREDRIPLQRECIRLSVGLGLMTPEDLETFDAAAEDFKTQLAQAADATPDNRDNDEEKSQ